MKKYTGIALSITISAFLAGCGSDDSTALTSTTTTSENLSGSTVVIETEETAASAAGSISVLSTASVSPTIPGAVPGAAPLTSPSFKSINLAPVSETQSCVDSGDYTISYDDENLDVFEITYNNCVQYSSTYNGGFTLTIDPDSNSTTSKYSYEVSDYSVISDTYSISMDYIAESELSMTFTDSILKLYSSSLVTGTATISDSSDTISVGFENYKTTASLEDSTGTYTIDGTASYNSSVDSCINGIYTFETIEPLTKNDTTASTNYTGGKLKINDATFTYNSDGTVDVTFADNTTIQNITPTTCN